MNKDNKIELVSCPRNGKNCHKHLHEINNNFKESIIYQSEKNYLRSAELLKKAFGETLKLKGVTCTRCAALYRSTIIESLENMHKDLRRMATGLFLSNRYKGSYMMVDNVLIDLKQKVQVLEKKNDQNIAS